MSKKTKFVNVNILSIYNMGQDTIIDGKKVEIDTVDGAIFSWFAKFQSSSKMIKKLIENKLYVWASYQAIADDMPYLKVKDKRVIARRIQKLVDIGLFEKIVVKAEGNKTYFHITEKAYESVINGDYVCTQKSIGYVPESTEVCTEKSIGVCTVESNNSILDNSILDNTKSKPKNEDTKVAFRFLIEEIQKEASRKSKVNFTEKGFEAYKLIKDKSQIKDNYINHQNTKEQYAQTIANFLVDYDANVRELHKAPKTSTNDFIDEILGGQETYVDAEIA